ncbi:DUF6000 family protein [Ohtaekwangia kribbensis]|uniref:DUF6000 family protein n=1 Tax=Ohtaekwangia kribbensis TaxID=688913 RepID=A0ABW3JW90_9BACT
MRFSRPLSILVYTFTIAMIDYTFHPKYVEPYYLLLMNANFIREPEKAPDLFRNLKLLSRELDNAQLSIMLKSSWRPAKVAAWIIGLSGRTELEEDLIQLMKYNASYCEHLIFALTLLDVEVKVLEEYITDQVKKAERLSITAIESISFGIALAARDWLCDKKGVTSANETFNKTWADFITMLEGKASRFPKFNVNDMLRLQADRKNFYKALTLVEQHQ